MSFKKKFYGIFCSQFSCPRTIGNGSNKTFKKCALEGDRQQTMDIATYRLNQPNISVFEIIGKFQAKIGSNNYVMSYCDVL